MKAISGVTLSGNDPGSIKCPYFDTIVSTPCFDTIFSSNLEKAKRFQFGNFGFFFFSEDLTQKTVGVIEEMLSFPAKLICGWNLPYFEVNETYKMIRVQMHP